MKTGNVHILVVDDDRRICNYVAKILSSRDWEVDTAFNGEDALQLAHKTSYDVMVLDYRMPGMDGAELYRRIREEQPDVRGVFLTAFPTIDTVYPAMEAGGDRVLAKPVDPNELVRTVAEQLV
jgi:DNA-binding response OmpR family regulator